MADVISVEQAGSPDVTILLTLTVGTTAMQIPYFQCNQLLIVNNPANTSILYIQLGPTVSSINGFPIPIGGSLRVLTSTSDKYWLVASASAQTANVAIAKSRESVNYN